MICCEIKETQASLGSKLLCYIVKCWSKTNLYADPFFCATYSLLVRKCRAVSTFPCSCFGKMQPPLLVCAPQWLAYRCSPLASVFTFVKGITLWCQSLNFWLQAMQSSHSIPPLIPQPCYCIPAVWNSTKFSLWCSQNFQVLSDFPSSEQLGLYCWAERWFSNFFSLMRSPCQHCTAQTSMGSTAFMVFFNILAMVLAGFCESLSW